MRGVRPRTPVLRCATPPFSRALGRTPFAVCSRPSQNSDSCPRWLASPLRLSTHTGYMGHARSDWPNIRIQR
eukprot:1190388-Pleurochrysis_carterae.AAC.1